MDAGFVILVVLALAIGIAFGMHIEKLRKSNDEPKGVLNVDCSDPDYGPNLFLQLEVPIEDVIDQKQVVFDVHVIM